jgi:cell shape-determining protein MreC
MIRICLIVAILAGIAVGTVNFLKVKEKITTLQTHLQEQTTAREKAESDLRKTTKDLETTKKTLDTTQKALTAANAEKEKAVADLQAANKRADDLNENLTATKAKLADAQADLEAYRLTGLKPSEIIALNNRLKASQSQVDENKVVIGGLERQVMRLTNELAVYRDPEHYVPLPANLIGKVVVVDPKYSFVILDVGESQGVLERGELLVSRNGKLVAKVRVTSVQKDRCIANILSGPSNLGQPIEGDLAIPAHPAS